MAQWVPPSERAGVDEDSRAEKLASLFGGKADLHTAAVLRRSPKKTMKGFGINLTKKFSRRSSCDQNADVDYTQEPVQAHPSPVVQQPRSEIVVEPTVGVSGRIWEQRHLQAKKAPVIHRRKSVVEPAYHEHQSIASAPQTRSRPEVIKATPKPVIKPLGGGFGTPSRGSAGRSFHTPKVRTSGIGSRSQSTPSIAQTAPGSPTRTPSSTSYGQRNVCPVCSRAVYAMDETRVDGDVFHRWCFKCKECNKTLSSGGYAKMLGQVYCKPHLTQLFKSHGNYDEGFGGSQRKRDWKAGESPEKAAVYTGDD